MTRANELQKKTIEKHTATANNTARESNNFNKNEKLYDEKKVVKMAKQKYIKIIFELINVYEMMMMMMIRREDEEINVMYKKNEK